MSTGSLNLDIILNQIQEDALSNRSDGMHLLRRQFPSLSERELAQLHSMFKSAYIDKVSDDVRLVVTSPASFGINAKPTMTTTKDLIEHADSSILITGYSLSDYFGELIDCIVEKSQTGVFVRFYVNDLEGQKHISKLLSYKGKFLKIYNYLPSQDKMSALHAKVVCVDRKKTLITSANLSYHGQEGNIELGTLIESKEIAKQVEDIFTKLLFKKVFTEV